MLLQHVTMEILINMLAAILNFVGFAGKKASKRLVTLAVSIPAHHKMAQMKGELVLKSIDILIMLLHHVTMEILIKKVAAILKFVCFGGKMLVKCFCNMSCECPNSSQDGSNERRACAEVK